MTHGSGHGALRAVTAMLVVVAALLGPPARLAAQDSKTLERDAWQRPEEVMDALGVKPGSVVADVGSGDGYFTFHLAARTGSRGKVFAEDIESSVLNKISARVNREHLNQIEVTLGTPEDPRLPEGALDAILVVDAFHEMREYDAMLKGMLRALKPGGLLGIIDRKAESGQPRSFYHQHHRIPHDLVLEDVKRDGFHFLREGQGFKGPREAQDYYFLIFQKP